MSEEQEKIYGIDLGTTYSAISVINADGKPEIIPNTEGNPITASAVYFENEENVIVGETAKEQGKIDSSRVVTLIKREMGTKWRGVFDDKEYTPEAISALILKYLVQGAEQAGHKVKNVVITCPAYFGGSERLATKNAGIIAGLNVLAVVDEPIAAALNYGVSVEDGETKNVIVYDLGGGTFDVSVVRIEKNSVSVICSDGNHKLGGADWDAALEQLLVSGFTESCPSAGNPLDDPDSAYELKTQAEKVKKKLSSAKETSVAVSHNGEKAKVVISRADFEAATRSLLDETIDFTDSMLAYAKEEAGVQKIDEFLLVGGSTYMPQVMELIREKYQDSLGVEPKVFEPNYAVSKGAAVFGQYKALLDAFAKEHKPAERNQPGGPKSGGDELGYGLEGEGGIAVVIDPVVSPPSLTIKTVASKSYGIRVLSPEGVRVCYNLIKKQTQVPCSGSQKFPVSIDNAATLPLVVLSNDCIESIEPDLEMCSEAGDATMELTPGLPKGAFIDVTFTLNEEGELTLTACDLTNNKEIKASFVVKDSLTQEEVSKLADQIADLTLPD